MVKVLSKLAIIDQNPITIDNTDLVDLQKDLDNYSYLSSQNDIVAPPIWLRLPSLKARANGDLHHRWGYSILPFLIAL